MSIKSEIVLQEKNKYNQLKINLDEIAEITSSMITDCGDFFEGKVKDDIAYTLNQLTSKYWNINLSIGTLQTNLNDLSERIAEEEKIEADNLKKLEALKLQNDFNLRSMPWQQ